MRPGLDSILHFLLSLLLLCNNVILCILINYVRIAGSTAHSHTHNERGKNGPKRQYKCTSTTSIFFPVHFVSCWYIIKLSDGMSDVPVNMSRCRFAARARIHTDHFTVHILEMEKRNNTVSLLFAASSYQTFRFLVSFLLIFFPRRVSLRTSQGKRNHLSNRMDCATWRSQCRHNTHGKWVGDAVDERL